MNRIRTNAVCILLAIALLPVTGFAQESEEAAWEYRPYQVGVLMCSDGSPRFQSNLEGMGEEIVRRSLLIDATGWNLEILTPTRQLQWKLLDMIANPESLTEMLALDEAYSGYDKIMCVCLSSSDHRLRARVRELDVQTQQWGPLSDRSYASLRGVNTGVTLAIKNAFMPIAEVDRVIEETQENGRKADKVYLRTRAIRTCLRARQVMNTAEIPGDEVDNDQNGIVDDVFGWTVEATVGSPVWVRETDRFLPIIRRTDRQGNLVRLDPIEFTYLTIDKQENAKSVCSIQSYHRAPLAGRKSKRARKLALVIRPPESSTTLRLIARDEEGTPLEGYEVWSGHPGAQKGEFDMLGETDWRGELEIPPSERGMRLLFIKHGNRALMKLPMIPGLYPLQITAVPDDETRLYAEGIIAGLSTEILNLVAQRNVYETEIDQALDNGDQDLARELLDKYQQLPTPQSIKIRLADERTSLKLRTSDRRELEYIDSMFDTLSSVLTSKVGDSKESEIRLRLQDPTYVPPETEDDISDDEELQQQPEPQAEESSS
ncbi:MAG: hypothetical protein AAF456_15600 [Planctomycetota bacterium]